MKAGDVVTALAGARRAVQLYPVTHPAHAEAIDALVAAVDAASSAGALVLNWHDGRLYHESVVLPDDTHGAAALSEAFECRHIESLSFAPGFSALDAQALTEVLSLRPSPELDVAAELERRGASAISVSVLEDNDEEREERNRQREADRAMYQRSAAALRRIQQQLAQGAAGADVGQASGLVGAVMERVLTDPSAVMGLATMRSTSERNLFHSLNVMIYALVLGQRLGLPDEGLSSLGQAALLHDIGKAAFDQNAPEQLEPMRLMHPEVGADMLQRCALDDPAPMLVAYEHHMSPDGSGWPASDEGYVSHPFSRMVAIADRYDDLTNPSGPETALTPDRAVVQVLSEGGTTLDPFFTKLFANALGVFPVGCLVRLSDLSVAVVVSTGEDPLSPVVRIAYDERGTDVSESALEIDLAGSDLGITEVIHPESLNIAIADKL